MRDQLVSRWSANYPYPACNIKLARGVSYAPAGSRARGTSMEGLYVAATLQVLMLPSFDNEYMEVTPLPSHSAC